MKSASLALALAGFVLTALMLDLTGLHDVGARLLAVGWRGAAALLVCQGALFVLLGLAWAVLTPGGTRRLGLYVWGRMVRDAASACLPLAQVGGFILGARVVTLAGIPWEQAAATTVVDATAEVLAQLAFAVIGLCILIARQPDSGYAIPFAIGVFATLVGLGGFMWAQLGAAGLFARLGRRIASNRLQDARARADALAAALDAIYARPGRLALASGLHLAGWLATGLVGYLAYRLLGARLEIEDAIAIEGLLHAITAAAFLIPGNIGVQEAGYTGLGAAFGVAADLSLGVSLLLRARDLALGLPVLLVWQATETRRLRRRRRPPSPAA